MFSRKTAQAITTVKTASRFTNKAAPDAGVRCRPNISSAGAAIPPKAIAPVRKGTWAAFNPASVPVDPERKRARIVNRYREDQPPLGVKHFQGESSQSARSGRKARLQATRLEYLCARSFGSVGDCFRSCGMTRFKARVHRLQGRLLVIKHKIRAVIQHRIDRG